MITITDVGHDGYVENYTLIAFHAEVAEVCKKAWEIHREDIVAIAIPQGMFPGLMEMINPVTRSVIHIDRQDMLLFCGFAPRPQYNDKGELKEEA